MVPAALSRKSQGQQGIEASRGNFLDPRHDLLQVPKGAKKSSPQPPPLTPPNITLRLPGACIFAILVCFGKITLLPHTILRSAMFHLRIHGNMCITAMCKNRFLTFLSRYMPSFSAQQPQSQQQDEGQQP
jgi:hypothetical protein